MAAPQTMGSYLRAARRRRRVSIERAAEDTRIRADFLMRLESDEFDFLAPAYVRGFLRSYARYLGVDPEPLTLDFDRRFGTGRVDTAQITALHRRTRRRMPREPIKMNRFTLLAVVVAGTLGLLALVGLITGPQDDDEPAGRVAARPSPLASPSPTSSPSATATPTASAPLDAVSFVDGIDVTVVAARAECWINVSTDGTSVFRDTLDVGEEAGPFTADERMDILLGNAYGVDLVVNGHRIGPLGEEGEVKPITLPDDFESLT